MTAPAVPQERVLGGMTRDEALKVYEVARVGALATSEEMQFVRGIAERVRSEHDLLTRAEDYPGILKYVQTVWEFDDPAAALERALDDLDRGMSDMMDGFADWRREKKKAKKERRKDLVLLAEAGDARCNELQDDIDSGNLPRSDVSRTKRELAALHGAVYRLWERIGS